MNGVVFVSLIYYLYYSMIEEWRNTDILEGSIQVSNMGRVRSVRYFKNRGMRIRMLTQKEEKSGYLTVSVKIEGKIKTFKVHRLVAMAFIVNKENKPQINHKDCNKKNNIVDNLEWCTAKENIVHAAQNGLLSVKHNLSEGQKKKMSENFKGENNIKAKLKEEQVIKIIEEIQKGKNLSEIAKEMGYPRQTIQNIARGKRWGYLLPEGFEIPKRYGSKRIAKIKEGIVVKEYDFISEAEKEFENKSAHSAISACCRGTKKSYMGFNWQYLD